MLSFLIASLPVLIVATAVVAVINAYMGVAKQSGFYAACAMINMIGFVITLLAFVFSQMPGT